MARFAAPKNSFLAGELSPKVFGRSELPEYSNGAKSLLNATVPIQGGVETRTGTQYMANPAVNPAKPGTGRLIPFIVNETEAYGVLVSDSTTGQGIQVFDSSGNVCTVTSYNTSVLPSLPALSILSSEVYQIQYAQSGDIMWFVHPNHRPFQLRRVGTNSFWLLYFDDPLVLSSLLWGSEKRVLFYPFLDLNTSSITLQIAPPATGASPEIYERVVTLQASSPLFDPGHVGAFFKLNPSGKSLQKAGTQVIRITSVVNSTTATGSLEAGTPYVGKANQDDVDGSNNFYPTPFWQESAWSDYRGWPSAITFFENRLLMAGTKHQPDTLWASRVDNYYHFMADMLVQDWNAVQATSTSSTITNPQSGLDFFGTNAAGQNTQETDPFAFTLSSQQVNKIQWLSGRETLSIGTLGAEYVANPGQDRILSAQNPSFVPQTNYGSAPVHALKAGLATLMVCRDGLTVRDFAFAPMFGVYKAPEVSLFAEHLFKGTGGTLVALPNRIIDWCFQASRNIVWFLLGNVSETQSLIGCTFDKDRNVVGFHHHILGGVNQYSDYNAQTHPCVPQVTGLCVIPGSSGQDDLWLNVTRLVNGSVVSYLEKMGAPFVQPDFNLTYELAPNCPIFSDCSKIVFGAPQTTWTGFDHLKGQTVSVLADGKIHPQVVVDNAGAVTLQYAASQLIVGLPYLQRVELLPVSAGAVLGSALGSIQRIDQAAIRFYATGPGPKIGRSDTQLELINLAPAGQPMTTEILPFTGMKRLPFAGDYAEETSVILVQDQPLPMNISSITLRGLTNET